MTLHERAESVALKYYESQVHEHGLEWVRGRSGFQIMVLDIAEAIHGALAEAKGCKCCTCNCTDCGRCGE